MEQGRLEESQLLSTHMSRNWENGNFWVTYAAYKTWSFDGIFWRYLDERFFGKSEGGFEERLKLLPREQVHAMEAFVERKLKEKDENTLIDWYAPDSEAKLPPDILSVGSSTTSDLSKADGVAGHGPLSMDEIRNGVAPLGWI